MTADADFGRKMERIETLLGELEERVPPGALDGVRELVRTLLDVHGTVLGELVQVLTERLTDAELAELAARPAVESVLTLHDLHPAGLEDRLARVLRDVNGAVAHQGRIELVAVAGERVTVRVVAAQGAGGVVVRRAFELAAADRLPDAMVSVEGGTEPADSNLIPAERLFAGRGTAAE